MSLSLRRAGLVLAVLAASLWMVWAAPVLVAAQTQTQTPLNEAANALGTGEVEQVAGPPQGSPLAGDALERRTAELSDLLRCPVCQGLSIGDSPSSLARQMKGLVRAMLAAGYTEDQILDYFQYSYGEFVLLRPPMTGASVTVWLAPVAALLLGGVVVWWWMRRSNRATAAARGAVASPAPAASAAPGAGAAPEVDAELAPYLERVRRLVGGETPAETRPRRNQS